VSPLWCPVYLLALAGVVRCVMRRQYVLPAILVLTIAMPDNARFVVTMVGLLAAMAAVEAIRYAGTEARRLAAGAIAGTVAAWSLLLFGLWTLWVGPLLTPADAGTARWVGHQTSPAAAQLVLTENREEAEWFPYLTARSGVIAEWGSEWTARYEREHTLFDRQASCLRRQSLPCLRAVLGDTTLRPSYLIVLHFRRYPRLMAQLGRSHTWVLVHCNGPNAVWRGSKVLQWAALAPPRSH
jgi:hypothetical protein